MYEHLCQLEGQRQSLRAGVTASCELPTMSNFSARAVCALNHWTISSKKSKKFLVLVFFFSKLWSVGVSIDEVIGCECGTVVGCEFSINVHTNHLEILKKNVNSDSVGLGLDLKFYICKQFSVDDAVFGPRTVIMSSKALWYASCVFWDMVSLCSLNLSSAWNPLASWSLGLQG